MGCLLFLFLLTNIGFAFQTSYQNLVSCIKPQYMTWFMKNLQLINVYKRRFPWWNTAFI